jgi:hypothetical protein
VAVFGLGGEAGGTTASHPRLALDGTRPLSVRGSGFRAHERVRLVLHRPAGARHRRATAGAGGTFSAAFRGVAVDRCSGFWVSASGSEGSRAKLVRRARPQCPPA